MKKSIKIIMGTMYYFIVLGLMMVSTIIAVEILNFYHCPYEPLAILFALGMVVLIFTIVYVEGFFFTPDNKNRPKNTVSW